MNEEQSVLHFFSQPENLPLALVVAEKMDELRRDLNNQFWLKLSERVSSEHPAWQVAITEHRDAEAQIVGINLQPKADQVLFLRPMMEQQNMGGIPRIYFGLMWSHEPSVDKTNLPAVLALQQALQAAGMKHNASFLGWQWSKLHPQRQDFLLRFSATPDTVLDEATALLNALLVTHASLIKAANAALYNAPPSATISLNGLRTKLKPVSNAP